MASKPKATLTHINAAGDVHMVDVSSKAHTGRTATAAARVCFNRTARAAIARGLPKGDAFIVARIAGIMAAKQTASLIPLCHPLPLTHSEIDIVLKPYGALITATTRTSGPTGVEMEAMTAASVAALTLYDMLKGVQRDICIEQVCLLEKSGGKSGHWKSRKSAASRVE